MTHSALIALLTVPLDQEEAIGVVVGLRRGLDPEGWTGAFPSIIYPPPEVITAKCKDGRTYQRRVWPSAHTVAKRKRAQR